MSVYRVSFTWNIHFKCNYRCIYCWFHNKWNDLEKINRYFGVDKILNSWKEIYKKYGSVHIDIIGGEPFIYPDFLELVDKLSQLHTIGISTNLSVNIETFVKKINPHRVGILTTFHPDFANLDDFIKKRLLLKEAGFGDKVAYLAYPPNIKYISYFKKKFMEQNLAMTVMTFWGEYNGISYPAGYTQDEKNIIEPFLGERAGEKFQLVPKKIEKNRLCSAGYKYAVINPDGNIYRCGKLLFNHNYLIGNLFDNNFELLKAPLPCNAEICPCNEYAFLLI